MFRRLPHPLLHQLGLHWPSPLLLRALPRPVRKQQPHRALEGHSPLPRFLFCWEYKKKIDLIMISTVGFLSSRDWIFDASDRDWHRVVLQRDHRLDHLLPHRSLHQPSHWEAAMDHMRKQANTKQEKK